MLRDNHYSSYYFFLNILRMLHFFTASSTNVKGVQQGGAERSSEGVSVHVGRADGGNLVVLRAVERPTGLLTGLHVDCVKSREEAGLWSLLHPTHGLQLNN